tara:strand:+ start:427 stop:801 length:375 start_codon:yes stop_codon:yes gene_type:complete
MDETIIANITATFFYKLDTNGYVNCDEVMEAAEIFLKENLNYWDGFGINDKFNIINIHVSTSRKTATIQFSATNIVFEDDSEFHLFVNAIEVEKIVVTEDNTIDPDDWDGIGESTMNKFDTGCK